MTVADLLERLVAHRDASSPGAAGGAFKEHVDRFTERLAMIRDCPPDDVTQAIFDQVSGLADQVIEALEQRLYDADDPQPFKRRLAQSVYAIRREIEDVYRWKQRFGRVK
jgi:hypothetical protein